MKVYIKGLKKEIEIDENRVEIQYAKKIVGGVYLSEEPEYLACKRFLNDLERQGTKDFPYIYDTTRADRFFEFFEKCANIDGTQGEFLKMEDFQKFDCGNIMAFVHEDTGVRRFKEGIIFQARGQGKSTECAVIELYVLTADKIYPPYQHNKGHFELNPNVVTLAVDREQTKQVRGTAMEMARRSPFLKEQADVRQTYIRGAKRGGEITAVSKETGNLDGGKLNLIIADEWGAHKEEQRINVLRGSFGKREQCLLLKITTAGDDAMIKPAKVDYDRCLEVLHGRIKDETYFIMIRQLGEKDNPADFSLYEKCAPMLRGNTAYAKRLLEQIKDEYNKAFNGGSEQQKIEYLIKRTNRWQVASEQKYLTQDMLDMLVASQVPEEEFLQMIQGKATVNGTDASKVIDLTGQGFIFNLPEGKIGIYAHGFMPSESIYRHQKTDKLPYQSYKEKGYLSFIEGSYIDNADLKQYLCDFESNNGLDVKAICADNAYCHQLLIDLDAGRTPNGKRYEVIEVPQTTSALNEACINFQKWLVAGKLIICKNDLFINHCANAYVEYDKGGRMKVAKKNKDSCYRIDLLACVLNALRRIDLLESENLINSIMSGNFSF